MQSQLSNIMYELSIYDVEFTYKVKSILSSPDISHISITNKKYNTPLLEIIKEIQNINPKLVITPYYSLKYQQQASLQDT
ncbi:MAG: hypothetical protein WD512_09810, partial [Candidatus Paceibacterota bacterium]